MSVFPYFFPYSGFLLETGNTSDKPFHTIRAVLLHFVRHMTVYVQRKRCGMVAQVFLHRLDVLPALKCGNGITMA